jgi:O-antigen ligase
MDAAQSGVTEATQRDIRYSLPMHRVSPTRWPLYLRTAVGTVISFEAALILFLFAGVYKADPRFAWLPVDITALFFVLSLLAGAYIIWTRGILVRRFAAVLLWLYGALFAYALLSTLWSPSVFYAHSKTLYLATLVFWPLAGTALIIAPERARYRRFFLLLLLFTGWVAVESALAFWLNTASGAVSALVEVLSGTYLSLSRVVAPGFLVLAAYALLIARKHWQRGLLGLLCVLFLAVLLVIGGRAPLIAAVLSGLILLSGLKPRLGRTPQRLLIQLALLAAAVLIMVAGWQSLPSSIHEQPATLRRISLLVSQGIEQNRRIQHYQQTLYYLDNNPLFGQGIGSWPVVVGYGDVRAYPHDIFLELLFELGVIGLCIFLAMLLVGLLSLPPWARLRRSPYLLLAVSLFVYALINASVSGDLNDNRLLFAALGLLLIPGAAPSSRNSAQPSLPVQAVRE